MPPSRHSIDDLKSIMASLRNPDTGCPWDIKQTFSTIAPYTIEEAYEVAEAIDNCDMDELQEELGDLLFQVIYHARMAEELEQFNFEDVVHSISTKMIRRHPHVFGDEKINNEGEVNQLWEQIKATEDESKNKSLKNQGYLSSIPYALPSLIRAVKLQSKAAKVGFDWPSIQPVFNKFKEEISELEQELNNDIPDQKAIEEEFGDLLFVLVNIGRHLKIDSEEALRKTNKKFESRFHYIETTLKQKSRTLDDATLEEMEAYWQQAKQKQIVNL